MSDMTREEAIEVIKQDIPCEHDTDLIKAMEIAIQALAQIDILKEAYNKGYKDGQEAIAFHLELCKDEGSIIEIPEGTTNGDMVKAVTHKEPLTDVFGNPYMTFTGEWWDAPYRKEK